MQVLGYDIPRPAWTGTAAVASTVWLQIAPDNLAVTLILLVILIGCLADLIFRPWHPSFTLPFRWLTFISVTALVAAFMWQPVIGKLKPDGPDLQAYSIRMLGGQRNAVKVEKPDVVVERVPFVVTDFSITNFGNLKSTATGYRMKAWVNGKAHYGTLIFSKKDYADTQAYVSPNDPKFDPEIIMFNKTSKPIEPGERVVGRLMFVFQTLSDIPDGTKIDVDFFDINSRMTTFSFLIPIGNKGRPGGTFVPGLDPLR